MPNKKKKYNARFPPARIKKIMQTDEDVGKVAAAVPVIISRALELFIESLILKASETTQSRHAKTLTTAHIKQTIESEKKFDFLRDLVVNITDHQTEEEIESNANLAETGKKCGKITANRGPRKRKDSLTCAELLRTKERTISNDIPEDDNDETDEADSDDTDQTEEISNATKCRIIPPSIADETPPVPQTSSNGFPQMSSLTRAPVLFPPSSIPRVFTPIHLKGQQQEDDDYDT
ncbi:dr1-associated corepressor [Octopus bimaculoides]|uniref:Dr1-associated corepressor n=1 Tax=Octopus bimaculoides TaxID=37653 RepID=A0A0L8H6W6_OCTBM|nr:dr1-associated corepressor [Octopus bimaculoides]XP_014775228.1 dr1-associated corepressor [Octopus bimaculoides]XP_014775229.1 dr1-associated corepressor [Octopus bimaculoides]XP_014775230.1 dr1-associated corepressor [Octopus bimaculoides]|eukprot:XP_014775227.1 PREDICTED: dr1-associated corepressor-like [Octopus bimaculoides]